MGKKLEKSIRGKKVFKHDKDFPIVKDRETMQIFSRILEILEILEIFFQNLGDSGNPYCWIWNWKQQPSTKQQQ